jgi:predicted ATP-grasp superfamily ATP-dependent carboligase/cellulose synthase/poly-beta-1,6-N-acetylglucosamine synthase-like glycosyltransferase
MLWEIAFLAVSLPLLVSYFGYPLLLRLMVILRRRGHPLPEPLPPPRDEELPSVSLLVAMYNEEAVVEEKIRNFLGLDYPADRLELLVISDCSSDRTCERANGLLAGLSAEERARVTVLDRRERTGKTIALSETIREVTSEILVFTDANTMYQPDAVRRMAERFREPEVGLVCGNLLYSGEAEAASGGEALYWRYENRIKRWEGELGQLLVANGSIYAFRRELFEPIPGSVADDMAVPLVVSTKGFKTVYEPTAIAEERLPEFISEDFRAKARIVARGFEAVRLFRSEIWGSGSFRITQYVLHKILRWLAFFFMALMLLTSLAGSSTFLTVMLLGQLGFYAFALVGFLVRNSSRLRGSARIPFYFSLVNVAAAKGFVDFMRGRTRSTWEKSESTRWGRDLERAPDSVTWETARALGPESHEAIIMSLSPTGLALARSLAPRGVTCWGVDAGRNEIGHRSRWVAHDPTFSYLEAGPELLERLLLFGETRLNPPVIYLAGDAYIDFTAEHHEELREHFILMDSVRPEGCSLLLNKQASYSRFLQLGIRMPSTLFPKTREDAECAAAELCYPAIVKPARGRGLSRQLLGERTVEVGDGSELLSRWQQIQDRGGEAVLQEVVPGPETNLFVAGLYIGEGNQVRSLFTARKYRQYPPTYGSGTYMESCWSDEIAELSADLVTRIAYRGICGIEYKWDPRDEEWKLLEMTPRPTLWYSLPPAAGVDIVWDAHCDLTGNPNPVHVGTQDDRMRWQLPIRDFLSARHLRKRRELGALEFLRTAVDPRKKRYGDLELADPAMVPAVLIDAASSFWAQLRKD